MLQFIEGRWDLHELRMGGRVGVVSWMVECLQERERGGGKGEREYGRGEGGEMREKILERELES